MKNLSWSDLSTNRKLLPAALAAFALAASLSVWQTVHAQSAANTPMSLQAAVGRHLEGLSLAHRGDEKGAFIAFLDAAENGYPPAQRRLGEIYDSGNSAVKRDYEESIRWYQKAREGGEVLPPQPSYGTMPIPRVYIGR